MGRWFIRGSQQDRRGLPFLIRHIFDQHRHTGLKMGLHGLARLYRVAVVDRRHYGLMLSDHMPGTVRDYVQLIPGCLAPKVLGHWVKARHRAVAKPRKLGFVSL